MGQTAADTATFLSDLPDWAAAAALLLLAGALGSALAALVRATGLARGSAHAGAVVGGLLAGLLIGPVVLGVVAPDVREGLVVGGLSEQDVLRRAVREQAGAIAALEVDGADPERVDDRRAEAERILEPQRAALGNATVGRERAIGRATIIAGGASLVLAFLGARTVRRSVSRRLRFHAIGPLAAAVPLAFTAGLLTLVGVGWQSSLVVGGICGVGWMLVSHRTRAWRTAGRDARTDLAASDALLLAGLASIPRTIVGLFAAGLLATPIAGRLRSPSVRARSRLLAMGIVLPTTIALAAARVDPGPFIGTGAFWLVVLIVLTGSTDARWFGALLGWRLADRGRTWRRSHDGAVAYVLHGAGAGQACVASMALAAGALDARLFAAAALAAVGLELSAGLYRIAPALFGFAGDPEVSGPA